MCTREGNTMRTAAYQQLRENLEELMRTSGINQSELARRACVPQKLINRLVNNQGDGHSPTLETLQSLANGLNVSVSQLLAPGFDPALDDPVETMPRVATLIGRLVQDYLDCDLAGRTEIMAHAQRLANRKLEDEQSPAS